MTKVVVVEDTDDLGRLLTSALAPATVHVIDVDFGSIAPSVWTSHDVAIIDRMLPGVDGCELARQAKAANQGIRVVVWSASGVSDDCSDADAMLSKPVALRKLLAACGLDDG